MTSGGMEEDDFSPPGWSRIVRKGRIIYSSPPGSSCVKIYSKSQLLDFHKKGRFLDVSEDQLVFTLKRKPKQKNYVTVEKKSCLSFDQSEVDMDDFGSVQVDGKNFSGWDQRNQLNEFQKFRVWREEDSADDIVQGDADSIGVENACENGDKGTTSTISIKERAKLEKEQAKLREAVLRLTINSDKQVDHREVLEATAKRLSGVRLSDSMTTESFNIAALKETVNFCKTNDIL